MSEVRPGYKQTDVGMIPEDWKTPRLNEVGQVDGGRQRSPGRSGEMTSYLRVANVFDGYIELANVMQMPFTAPEKARFLLKPGDILLNEGQSLELVGRSAIYTGNPSNCCFQNTLVRFRARERADAEYCQRVFQGYLRAGVFASIALQTTSIAHLGTSRLAALKLPLPPLPEQKAIAGALRDADGLIDALERLIAKKRAIKQGAMQGLLTGDRRLPGFKGQWPCVSLGALYDFKNGLNKGKEYFGVGIPIVNYMDVFRSPALSMAALHGRVTVTPDEVRAYGVQQGDVFFTRTSETQEDIGMTSVMLDHPFDCVFSGFLLRARPKSAALVSQYAKYCFTSYAVRQQIIARSSYTTRALTNGRALSMVELNLPEPHEQRAIAVALSDMDAEITALEEKLVKARAVKQGMMQVLLTGEIRLV